MTKFFCNYFSKKFKKFFGKIFSKNRRKKGSPMENMFFHGSLFTDFNLIQPFGTTKLTSVNYHQRFFRFSNGEPLLRIRVRIIRKQVRKNKKAPNQSWVPKNYQ